MEDVLDVYALPYDPLYPVVCLDEKLVTLHGDVVPPLPVAPEHGERVDYTYARAGTANLFVLVEPLAGWRQVTVTTRRTARDYAEQLHWLAEVRYPHAHTIRLIQDNLNTHTLASLYRRYPAAEARRLAQRFEIHATPPHGSWLDMAEIEIGVFTRGCLSRRVTSRHTLCCRVAALQSERNAHHATITWRFTTPLARQKFHRFYERLLAEEEMDSPTT